MPDLIVLTILSIIELAICVFIYESWQFREFITPVISFLLFGALICFNGFVISIVVKETKKKYRKARW